MAGGRRSHDRACASRDPSHWSRSPTTPTTRTPFRCRSTARRSGTYAATTLGHTGQDYSRSRPAIGVGSVSRVWSLVAAFGKMAPGCSVCGSLMTPPTSTLTRSCLRPSLHSPGRCAPDSPRRYSPTPRTTPTTSRGYTDCRVTRSQRSVSFGAFLNTNLIPSTATTCTASSRIACTGRGTPSHRRWPNTTTHAYDTTPK